MNNGITNIHEATFEQKASPRDEPDFHSLDISGEHIGAHIEVLPPGSTSSYHHYHTAEEEHVLVLEGTATLHLGEDQITLSAGDHVCFPAGRAVAHHIANDSDGSFRFLVFGERKKDDVVFYPEGQVVLVKSSEGLGWYNYEDRNLDQ